MSDRHWLPAEVLAARRRKLTRVRVQSRALHVAMPDGVAIAIDVHVPSGERIPPRMPAIVRQTRYLRSLDARTGFEWLAAQFDLNHQTRRDFLRAGYAWVDVDVRGTGASGGAWRAPWFDDEVHDGARIVDWIVAQPWSNGRVGSLGISYDGTCAEMLLANRHPAVRAVAPLFSLHDIYADVAFPGGVHLAWFTNAWSRYNATLDRNAFAEAISAPLWLMSRAAGRAPSANRAQRWLGDRSEARFRGAVRAILGAAIRGGRQVDGASMIAPRSENLDVHAGTLKIVFRDDTGLHPDFPERTIDSLSPHNHRALLSESGAAIYNYSGWRDGAYPSSAVKRWRDVPNHGSRLTLGPWAHTGKLRIHAFELGAPTEFDHGAELLDFFDEHLQDEPTRGDGAKVHYFVMGEERWRADTSWPPPRAKPRTLYLGADRALVTSAPASEQSDTHPCNAQTGSGERSRWRSLLALIPGDYPDRRTRDERLLCYQSAPLDEALVVAGEPALVLFAAWSEPEAARLFAYLEDVAPDGRVSYVSEGQLLARHRKRTFLRADDAPLAASEVAELEIELLPIAYAFAPGHSLRIALATSDADHFALAKGGGTYRVHTGGARASRLVLPVVAS